jgi:para-aminobenzoate synthetase component 1
MIHRLDISALDAWRRLRHLRHVVWLDSAKLHPDHGRWSLLLVDPLEVIWGSGRRISWRSASGLLQFEADPWEAVDYFLSRRMPGSSGSGADLPAALSDGIVAGYLGYELGHALERLPAPGRPVLDHPDFWLAYYDTSFVFDHAAGSSWLVSSGHGSSGSPSAIRAAFRRDQFLDELESGVIEFSADRQETGLWQPLVSRQEYEDRFDRIQRYIRQGDIYQANLTYPFLAERPGNSAALYEKLRQLNPAPFGAYLDGGAFRILSSSPEEFLKIRGREARTRPVKGTCPRVGDAPADWDRARRLLDSGKNRAELLMITDLLRNDLGRIAEFGSVAVPELVQCEEYATVYHLVSTVTAHLRPGQQPLDVLAACFPGGSITGAPKLRAQEIIHECERWARGVYTGSIGFFARGLSQWSIAIRTMICAEGAATFSVGGAVTADSTAEDEYRETLDKARALLLVIGDSACYKKGFATI